MSRFLYMWRNGKIDDDVTWRNYSILNFSDEHTKRYVRRALKAMGFNYAGELAMGQFAALYEVQSDGADRILAAWWVWSRLAEGRGVPGVKIRPQEPPGGVGATTPAADPPKPA